MYNKHYKSIQNVCIYYFLLGEQEFLKEILKKNLKNKKIDHIFIVETS